jgi:hypothetical protein
MSERNEFKPNWQLSSKDKLAVALTLALSKHIPGWTGATDEELGAVAGDILANVLPVAGDNAGLVRNHPVVKAAMALNALASEFEGDLRFCGEALDRLYVACDALRREDGMCPACGSTAPHLHPAVQHEGEVKLCADPFHLTPTPQNKPDYIAAVEASRAAISAPSGQERK